MKKVILSLVMVFTLSFAFAQKQEALFEQFWKDIVWEDDSVFSVFRHIVETMKYDMKMFQKPPTYSTRDELFAEALKNRKGLCEHYAEIMHRSLLRLGHEAYLVSGYIRQDGKLETSYGHTWNALRKGGQWYLLDATWAAGHVENDKFVKQYDPSWYKKSPEEMLQTHYPFDPLWQLIPKPVSHEWIKKGMLSTPDEQIAIDFDAIIQYERTLSESAQAKLAMERIEQAGVTNKLIAQRMQYLGQLVKQGVMFDAMAQINMAVDKANEAALTFNAYLEQKNRGFKHPEWTSEKKKAETEKVKALLNEANTLVSEQRVSDPNIQAQVKDLRRNITSMLRDIEREIKWLERNP